MDAAHQNATEKVVMISRALIYRLILLTVVLPIAACGSSDDPASGDQAADSADESFITLDDRTFTLDSFTEAGWKKSKQYDTETVPNSTEIWYGFFNQRDIEVRFYETHEEALEFGVPSARESIEGAVGRSQGGKLLDFSGGSFSAYADFMVAGNAVLLCEL